VIFANGDEPAAYRVAKGAAETAHSLVPALIKVRTSQATDEIDLYVPLIVVRDETPGRWGVLLSINLEAARSQGRVRLTAPDPAAALEIDHAYFADPTDLEACCDGIELIARLVCTQPLADVLEPIPGRIPTWRDRAELRAWVREHVTTTFHPSGTCRMGPESDPESVVDHAGQVHGIAGLRVADASVFPTIPRANIHCTIVAVAEKLADAFRSAVA
jgi:choline dehydrogenase